MAEALSLELRAEMTRNVPRAPVDTEHNMIRSRPGDAVREPWVPVTRAGKVEPKLQQDGTVVVTLNLSGTILPEWREVFTLTRSLLTTSAKFQHSVPVTLQVRFMPDELAKIITEIDQRIERANAVFEQQNLPQLQAKWDKDRQVRDSRDAIQARLQEEAAAFERPPRELDL
jgi:hypothetical protein